MLGKYSPLFRKEKYFVNYDVKQFTVANISQRLKNRSLTSSGTKASLNSVLAASDQSFVQSIYKNLKPAIDYDVDLLLEKDPSNLPVTARLRQQKLVGLFQKGDIQNKVEIIKVEFINRLRPSANDETDSSFYLSDTLIDSYFFSFREKCRIKKACILISDFWKYLKEVPIKMSAVSFSSLI